VQLLGQFTAAANLPDRVPVAQKESACITEADFHQKHAAEIVQTFRLLNATGKIRVQRYLDVLIAITNRSNYLSGEIHTRVTAFPFIPGIPLVRLLLFPPHYFW
jgi:hypothetical protein